MKTPEQLDLDAFEKLRAVHRMHRKRLAIPAIIGLVILGYCAWRLWL
jgi:hypothetical protein